MLSRPGLVGRLQLFDDLVEKFGDRFKTFTSAHVNLLIAWFVRHATVLSAVSLGLGRNNLGLDEYASAGPGDSEQ